MKKASGIKGTLRESAFPVLAAISSVGWSNATE